MDSFNNEIGRVDYTVSDRSRLAFNVRHNNRSQVTKNYFNNAATGTTASRTNWGGTADAVYSFNSTTVLDVRGNVTYFGETHGAPSAGLDPTVLGFPSYMTSASQYLQMPFIAFAGSCVSQASIQCLGATGANSVPSRSYQVFADLVKNIDRHALKIGTDVRRYRLDNISYGNSAGTFTFGTNWTAGPNSASAAAPFGQDFAAFLLGLPTSGQYDVSAQGVFHSNYYAVFAQDDWRVSNTVTLNLGLRFERDTPYAEEQGRTVNGFDVNAISPIAAAAQAAYALHPIPQISAGAFGVRGGLTFPAASSGAVYDSGSSMLSPRIGFAWQPERLNGRTVFRGGYGVYVSAITMASLPPGGIYSSNPIVNQEGFSATTSFVPTLNNFLTPSATLTTPFSGGIAQPIGSSLGLSTFMGQTVSFLSPTMKAPYSRRWSVGVQRELGTSLMAEVDYLGNHTARLPVAVSQLNGIPRQYLSTLSTRDPTTINALSATVPNPFAGMLPGTTLNGSTTSVAQLLAAFPEFPVGTGSTSTGVLMQNNTIGTSDFESVSVRLQRRPTSGVMLSGTYTLSRLIEADSYLNDTDTEPERRISPFDHTHHFVVAASYELPFGEGRAVQLRTNWARLAFEGWRVNGIYTYQTGAPLSWSNDMVYNGTPITLDPRNIDGPAFNTSAFDTNSKDQFQYHIRIFPSMFNSLRIDAINNLDASILKRFVTGRGSNLQIRLEIFNVLNHPTFSPPNVTPTSASFGMVTSQANLPRQAQIGVRFVF